MKRNSVQSTELFIKHFNCACFRILKNGKAILYGSPTANAGYRVSNKKIWEVDLSKPTIHPFVMMLNGRYRNYDLSYDIFDKYSLPVDIGSFIIGFYNNTYSDIWDADLKRLRVHNVDYNDEVLQNLSVYFNIGRAFLHKFSGIRLPYYLNESHGQIFTNLRKS